MEGLTPAPDPDTNCQLALQRLGLRINSSTPDPYRTPTPHLTRGRGAPHPRRDWTSGHAPCIPSPTGPRIGLNETDPPYPREVIDPSTLPQNT